MPDPLPPGSGTGSGSGSGLPPTNPGSTGGSGSGGALPVTGFQRPSAIGGSGGSFKLPGNVGVIDPGPRPDGYPDGLPWPPSGGWGNLPDPWDIWDIDPPVFQNPPSTPPPNSYPTGWDGGGIDWGSGFDITDLFGPNGLGSVPVDWDLGDSWPIVVIVTPAVVGIIGEIIVPVVIVVVVVGVGAAIVYGIRNPGPNETDTQLLTFPYVPPPFPPTGWGGGSLPNQTPPSPSPPPSILPYPPGLGGPTPPPIPPVDWVPNRVPVINSVPGTAGDNDGNNTGGARGGASGAAGGTGGGGQGGGNIGSGAGGV